MSEISQERRKYHELLPGFIQQISHGAVVYDIGKSVHHDYAKYFNDMKFKVIDMDDNKSPDILLNIEGINNDNVKEYLQPADAILCNGVIEQCYDPMQMIRSCNAILKQDGLILFGFCLLGYPIHDVDRFRFTTSGAEFAVKRSGFEITQINIIKREAESYIYVMARKTKNV